MTLRRALLTVAALVLGFAGQALAIEPAVEGTVTVRFAASSTLHGFAGTAGPAGFRLEPSPGGSWRAVVEVPVAALTTDNSWRDKNMRVTLKADAHPSIHATFTAVVPDTVRTSGSLPFRLSIGGVERELTAEVSSWQQAAEKVEFDAVFLVSLSAFGLEAPGALFMRVDDSVKVTAHVTLVRK